MAIMDQRTDFKYIRLGIVTARLSELPEAFVDIGAVTMPTRMYLRSVRCSIMAMSNKWKANGSQGEHGVMVFVPPSGVFLAQKSHDP